VGAPPNVRARRSAIISLLRDKAHRKFDDVPGGATSLRYSVCSHGDNVEENAQRMADVDNGIYDTRVDQVTIGMTSCK
jgi:hypothetical protein